MSVWCTCFGHKAGDIEVYNSGYWFSACARCGEALLRAPREDWRIAPRGHRIVWKSGRHCHSVEADYADVLPVPVASPTLPALPGRFAAWRRDLVPFAHRARFCLPAGAAAAAEDATDFRCPRLLLAAVMLGAGLKMLLTFGAAR